MNTHEPIAGAPVVLDQPARRHGLAKLARWCGLGLRPEQEVMSPSGQQSLVAPLVTAGLLALVFVRIPLLPLSTDIDSSWCAVLDYARRQHLQYGADINFTYGPLGFITMPYVATPEFGLQMVLSAGFCL